MLHRTLSATGLLITTKEFQVIEVQGKRLYKLQSDLQTNEISANPLASS